MGEKIALGFHTCVDYELKWDLDAVINAIKEYDIHDDELVIDTQPTSERGIWTSTLAYMKQGMGGEIVPSTPEVCEDFAKRFQYKITIGGTSTRAAIAIEKIGYSSVIQMSCYNSYIRDLLPKRIHYYSSVGLDHTDSYPHISVTYNKGVRICANDIDFVTSRENRVLISRDIDSQLLVIKEEFYPLMQDAEVFLMSCFSQIVDEDILKARLKTTKALLSHINKDTIVVAEDGCYVEKSFRYMVHRELAPCIDILSMNEDELQEYIERRIDVLDVDAVLEAVKYVYDKVGVPTIVVHSADWAIAYGKYAYGMREALESAITMAATRIQYGDEYGLEEYNQIKALGSKDKSVLFSKEIKELAGDIIECVPSKDMSFVKNPTVVGLGDTFIGGMLPELLKARRKF